MQERQDNFFDPKTIIAIILCGAVFFGWQSYLAKKYPPAKGPESSPQSAAADSEGTQAGTMEVGKPESKSQPGSQKSNSLAEALETPEQFLEMNVAGMAFRVSNFGMGLHDLTLQSYTDREKNPVKIGNVPGQGVFATISLATEKPIVFILRKTNESTIEGVSNVEGAVLKKKVQFDDKTGSFRTQVVIENAPAGFRGLATTMIEPQMVYGSGSFLIPSFEHQEIVAHYGGKNERFNVSHLGEILDKSFPAGAMVAISSQYFTAAISDKSEVLPDVKVLARPLAQTTKSGEQLLTARMEYRPINVKPFMEINYVGYAGPKSHGILKSVDSEMVEIINFGFFASIAKLLLVLLQWFHSFVSNWGLAIIVLTILVRFIVLPFNIASYNSMKKMQKIQPMIQSLRERYKDDAQKLNTEMMSLMRENKVNPLGGCLPMLLQMPVFFALYQVLGQSIELYQAPFVFWINDLSLKDPFYVLPVLMGLSMYVQQKITPTTMDPMQAKILQFLPIVFALMMVALPSGLTLYIFISTLFGIIQQQIFMRDKSALAATKEAKA
ncbi:MAG: membrane protein insertase YidC [Proteobacteria bacterium]|nr:membrane protein insertase YidC [Pseudomonadota bacterium]